MRDSYKELRYPELVTKREEIKTKYLDLRFDMVVHHVDNPLEKRNLRRRFARLNTMIHEYALGIRTQNTAREAGEAKEAEEAREAEEAGHAGEESGNREG